MNMTSTHGKVKIIETRWHPGSSYHIVTLANDGFLRIHNLLDSKCTLELKLASQSMVLESLGETVISFDFGAPTDSNLWPIYLLRGNGDVLLVYNNLETSYMGATPIGPLTMRPPSEDNYGYDASSLICLNCVPNILVIATSSGIIYHCLAISDTLSLLPEPILFVAEILELNFSIISQKDQDLLPVRLHKCLDKCQIYFAYHSAGVHVINVPFVQSLNSETFSGEVESSVIEHLICTKPSASLESPIGLTMLMDKDLHMSVLMSNQYSLYHRLEPLSIQINSKQEEKIIKRKNEFDNLIDKALKRDINLPILKTGEKQPTLEESLQTIAYFSEVIKAEYLTKMNGAVEIIRKKVDILIEQKEKLVSDISKFNALECFLLESVKSLTKKYDEVLEKQEKFYSRIERSLINMRSDSNELTDAEKKMKEELKTMAYSIEILNEKLERAILKSKYTKERCKAFFGSKEDVLSKKEVLLPDQIKSIKKILKFQSDEIETIVKRTNALKPLVE